MATVIEPTVAAMADAGHPFHGFLYAGLALTREGPKVLEFNVRLGDPETQAILPRLESDLIDVLEGKTPEWSDRAAVNVVLAARGYPEAPATGSGIDGLADVPDEVHVFHAGTKREGKRLIVFGGRVLSLVGVGATLDQARDRAYDAAELVHWPGMQFRTDIAAHS
jgi:phosphoribosylamine--glycine ligase